MDSNYPQNSILTKDSTTDYHFQAPHRTLQTTNPSRSIFCIKLKPPILTSAPAKMTPKFQNTYCKCVFFLVIFFQLKCGFEMMKVEKNLGTSDEFLLLTGFMEETKNSVFRLLSIGNLSQKKKSIKQKQTEFHL